MNKRLNKLIAFAILTLLTGVCLSAEPNDGNTPPAEQDDPFGGFGAFDSQISDFQIGGDPLQARPELFVQTVTLKFLNALQLRNALVKMPTEFGSIGVDDNTNSVIICDTKENLEKIVTEVKKADQTPKQIIIEVVIIDVQLKDDTEIGVDWDFLTTDNKDASYRQSLIFPNRLAIVPPTPANLNNTTAFQNIGLGSELAIVNDDIRNVINLLQEKRDVDILASPRVMVVSGQKAEIKTVEEIPYQQLTQTSAGGGGAGAITSTEFKEVGVKLQVKATLTDDGKILLDVVPEQSVSTGDSIGGVPVIDTRQASTTLLMDDGQVVVMGGLRRQQTRKIKFQVPLLGDIPLIGLIFSDTRTIVENSELLVLLSPHIYQDEPVSAEAMARFNQIRKKSLITMPQEPKPKKSPKKK